MKRITLAIVLFLSACSTTTAQPAQNHPPHALAGLTDIDPLACTGYDEPRVWLEVQSWWKEPTIALPMHLHAGTCFPLKQTVTGLLRLDVRVMLHKNPGKLIAVSTDIYTGPTFYQNVADVTCTDPSGLCEYWYTFYVDTTEAVDGWRELRLKPRVQLPPAFDTDPGATQITSTGWPFRIDNGSHSTAGNRDECNGTAPTNCQVQFRGWYEHDGYANFAVFKAQDIVPQPTWSGASKSLKVRFYNSYPNGEDQPLTAAYCYIDPDFHNPSWVPNPFYTYTGTFPVTPTLTIPLSGLSAGDHRIGCRADAEVPPGQPTPGTLSGLGVFKFTYAP